MVVFLIWAHNSNLWKLWHTAKTMLMKVSVWRAGRAPHAPCMPPEPGLFPVFMLSGHTDAEEKLAVRRVYPGPRRVRHWRPVAATRRRCALRADACYELDHAPTSCRHAERWLKALFVTDMSAQTGSQNIKRRATTYIFNTKWVSHDYSLETQVFCYK